MKKTRLFFALLPLMLASCSAGAPGADGVTPRIGSNGNWWIGETDTGVKAAGQDGKDGVNGKDGKDGVDGKDGTNGKDGADGKDGLNGKDGTNGKDGVDGKDGANGKDGVDGKDGADGKDGLNGKDGVDGKDGADGKDGIDGKDGADGKNGADGKDGVDGKDGADGKDGVGVEKTYFNEEGELIIVYTNGEEVNLGHVYEDKVEVRFYKVTNPEVEPELLATEYHERGSVINVPEFESNPFKGFKNVKWWANKNGGEIDYEHTEKLFEWTFEKDGGYFADQLVYDVNYLYGAGQPESYKITYDMNDDELHPATLKEADEFYFGQPYEIKDPERTGYDFVKWVLVPEKYEGKLEDLDAFETKGYWNIDNDVELTAVWAIKTQKITWMNGKEEIYNEKVAYFETPKYNPEYVIKEAEEEGEKDVLAGTPQKESSIDTVYTFDGWSLTDGGEKLEKLPAVDKDATYYAHYSESVRKYTITFLNDDELHSEIYHIDVPYGDVPVYDPEHVIKKAEEEGEKDVLAGIPQKEKTAQYTYAFEGWQLDKDNQYPTGEALPKVKGDTTYTAYFSETVNEYTISFVDEDGKTELQKGDVAYGKVPVYEGEEPHKPGDKERNYYFYGWTDGKETYAVNDEEFELPAVTGAVTYKAVYEVLEDVDKFEFTYQEEVDNYVISKYNGEAKDVVIPSTYLDKPVIGVGPSAFAALTTLETVTFREDSYAAFIDSSAFAADTALKEVTLSDGILDIHSSAFAVCTALKTLNLGYEKSGLNNVYEGAFAHVSGLTINYAGSEAMFKKINVAEMNNDGFKNATINYSFTDINYVFQWAEELDQKCDIYFVIYDEEENVRCIFQTEVEGNKATYSAIGSDFIEEMESIEGEYGRLYALPEGTDWETTDEFFGSAVYRTESFDLHHSENINIDFWIELL